MRIRTPLLLAALVIGTSVPLPVLTPTPETSPL